MTVDHLLDLRNLFVALARRRGSIETIKAQLIEPFDRQRPDDSDSDDFV